MAKRFTDSDKWKKPFIRGMEAPYKLLWLYILDDCDHAGIWQVDEDVARIRVGTEIDFNEAIKLFGNHIQLLDYGQKWFIPDFIEFQYGTLNPENRVHKSVIDIHNKYKIKPLISPLKGAKDKDKEKDKDKDIEKEVEKIIFPEAIENIFTEFLAMRKKSKKPVTEYAEKLLRDKLKKLSDSKQNKAIEIMNQSIQNNWSDLYPLKENNNGITKSRAEQHREIADAVKAKLTGNILD